MRVRIVEGSCWSCKKRRIKCDLARPSCHRCRENGGTCDYNTRLIRWSRRPVFTIPTPHPALSRLDRPGPPLDVFQKRALDYFHRRVWPLLSSSAEPYPPPFNIALEHRFVLLATCSVANSHRVLQDGRIKDHKLHVQRLECLTEIRLEVDGCCVSGRRPPVALLVAVLLVYLQDGFFDCRNLDSHGGGGGGGAKATTSISSHHRGLLAILDQLGGIRAVLATAQDSLNMLLSEFASTDLTSAMLQGRDPSFAPEVWDAIDQGAVWWERDPLGHCSLASVFRDMAAMVFYRNQVGGAHEDISMDVVRGFEEALRPGPCPKYLEACTQDGGSPRRGGGGGDRDAFYTLMLVRAFQHSGLIYLYRAVCGLPTRHPLVQLHVKACLDCMFRIQRPSKALHCAIFPLCVAGAHALAADDQQEIRDIADVLYDSMKFASIRCIMSALEEVWGPAQDQLSWDEAFTQIGPHTLVL